MSRTLLLPLQPECKELVQEVEIGDMLMCRPEEAEEVVDKFTYRVSLY